jgi:hypothetical protein
MTKNPRGTDEFSPAHGLYTVDRQNRAGQGQPQKENIAGKAVLITGANRGIGDTAEVYNPSTGVWQVTGALNVSRASGAAALLENGQVLFVDGYNTVNNVFTYLASAELYNPSTGEWSLTARTREATSSASTPVLLTNGDVLIADEAQFYNPGTAFLDQHGPTSGDLRATHCCFASQHHRKRAGQRNKV